MNAQTSTRTRATRKEVKAGLPKTNGSQRKEVRATVISTQAENNLRNLLTIVGASFFWPPLYVESIIGRFYTWTPPYRKYSEFTIANPWNPLRTLRFLRDLWVPAAVHEPSDWARTLLPPAVHEVFWRPSTFYQQPDPYDSDTSFPAERWFYINGVATNEDVARMNSALLSHLFHRPLTVIHNATASLPLDLTECAIGKGFKTRPRPEKPGTMTEPALKATNAILSAMLEPERDKVVVLAHSQGTIITANVLRALRWVVAEGSKLVRSNVSRSIRTGALKALLDEFTGPVANDRIQMVRDTLAADIAHLSRQVATGDWRAFKKLEVYTFAACADKMKYVVRLNGKPYPWLEHFANEQDLVARLGVLSPLLRRDDQALVDLDGSVYVRPKAWGHLLNEHYLYPVFDYLSGKAGGEVGKRENPYPLRTKGGYGARKNPRLYDYFEGASPVK